MDNELREHHHCLCEGRKETPARGTAGD
jgi:hypothetical protein